MEKANCCVCQKPNPTLECAHCHEGVCKKCAMFLEEGSFSFMKQIPQILQASTFCNPCYITQVEPALENYNQQMEAAKNVRVYLKDQSKESRLISRKEAPIKVLCDDKDQTLLRLAFLAQEAGFNGLVDVEINSTKERKGGTWQKATYSGVGIPAHIASKRIVK